MTRLTPYLLAALIFATFALEPAFAQIAGGASGGLFSGFLQWFSTNLLQGIILIAVLFIGIVMALGQHSWMTFGITLVGCYIIANYQTIAGLIFGTGG